MVSSLTHIGDDIITCYLKKQEHLENTLSKISSLIPKTSEEPILPREEFQVKERKVRIHCDKLALILSETSYESEVFEGLSDDLLDDN